MGGRRRQNVAELKLQMARIGGIERDDPVRSALGRVVDGVAVRQVCDRRGFRNDACIRELDVDVDQPLGCPRRHSVRISRINDIVLLSANKRSCLLLDRKFWIGRCGHFGGRTKDLHAT